MTEQELHEYKAWALAQMAKYGISEWSFRWTSSLSAAGVCDYKLKRIRVSKQFLHLGFAEFQDTVWHEIAHAKTPGDSHGAKWRRLFVSMGGSGKIKLDLTVEQIKGIPKKPKWYLACPDCGQRFHINNRTAWYRKPKTILTRKKTIEGITYIYELERQCSKCNVKARPVLIEDWNTKNK